VETDYDLEDQGIRGSSPDTVENFFFFTSSRTALGTTQPAVPMLTGGSFPGVKRPRRQADILSATSAEVKEMWIYTFTLPYDFMA
jgi:hypothetical protein